MAPAVSMLHVEEIPLDDVIAAIEREGAVAMPMLAEAARGALLEDAMANPGWRKARDVIGEGERAVLQRMDVCESFPPDSPFHALVGEFQSLWDAALEAAPISPFESALVFDDLMLQRYTPGAVGITAHRDHVDYRNLVCLFVLAGRGRFCLCEDRSGHGEREIRHDPGDVILTRAPGFLGSGARPFHLVRDIASPRYVFGLRQRRSAAAG